MPKKSQETFSFPRGPMPLGKASKEGVRAIEAEHEHEVLLIAADAAKRIDAGELAEGEAFHKWLHERVEAAQKGWDFGRMLRCVLGAQYVGDELVQGDLSVSDAAFDAMYQDTIDALDEDGYEIEPDDSDDDDADDDEEEARQ